MRKLRAYDTSKSPPSPLDPKSIVPQCMLNNSQFIETFISMTDEIGGIEMLKRNRGEDNSKIDLLLDTLKSKFASDRAIIKSINRNNILYTLKCLYISQKDPETKFVQRRARVQKKRTAAGNTLPSGQSSRTTLRKIKKKCIGQLYLDDEKISDLTDEQLRNIYASGDHFVGTYEKIEFDKKSILLRTRDIRAICILHLLACENAGLIRKDIRGKFKVRICDWIDHSRCILQSIYKGLTWFLVDPNFFKCETTDHWRFVTKPLLFLKGLY
jgi:hypothetical protein